MPKAPRISEAEWEVMEILWRQHPLTAAELIAQLAKTHEWAPNTIRTMLARLVKKGALAAREEGNAYLYTPLLRRTESVQEEVDSLLGRVFGGSLQPLLLHFVKQKKLSPEEMQKLRAILDETPEDLAR